MVGNDVYAILRAGISTFALPALEVNGPDFVIDNLHVPCKPLFQKETAALKLLFSKPQFRHSLYFKHEFLTAKIEVFYFH